ncbi:30S ribosomal protein S1 [Candidatus Babeliales bacterium]|nr:30S ribosomal protein S1 [Candidatus Babeliales bacterium]
MPKSSNKHGVSEVVGSELLDELFQLNDEQKAELTGLFDDVFNQFQVGKILKGNIVNKDNGGVIVDISYKSNGLIPAYEFSEFEFKKLAVEDKIEVLLDRLEDENGNVVLSYQKAKSLKAWDRLLELAENDEPVRGVVIHKVKGGLSVDIGVPAFLPGSQVDVQRVTNFDQFVGQEIVCKILKVNKKRGNVIVSRRKYLEVQRTEDKKKALETLAENQVLQGIVKNITNNGVFVDVGGIDRLLHITDMSWRRIAHPSEVVKIGDTITVKIISFDKEHEKISLGMKQLEDNPWEKVEEKYSVGSNVKGRISSIADYGLFIEVDKGVEGLAHISEISWTERINNLSKHYSVGDELDVVIVAIDKDNKRMSLSVKRLYEDPWKVVGDKFTVGDKISGAITNITDFGIFVQLYDGVDGLVHISDISWTEHIVHPTDRYKKADVIDAVILSIDPGNKKISLGIKQLAPDPWENITDEYPLGKVVEGTVSKVTNFGAFVKLPIGIEGLVHISELSDKEVEKVDEIIKVGETMQFKVIKASKEERKLGLSLRALTETAGSNRSERVSSEPRRSFEKRESSRPREKREMRTDRVVQTKTILQQAFEEHAQRMNDAKKDDDKSEDKK